MTVTDAAIELGWNDLATGSEISATVIMASGFVLEQGQTVRERYRVERVLGQGSMGQVIAVTLVGSADAQTYALKVVARPATTEVTPEALEEASRHARWFAELLRQEAAKQDAVQRQGVSVARLFALVQLDDGSIGLRMELARGRSLEATVNRARKNLDAPPDVAHSLTVVRKLVSQLRRLHEMVEPGSPLGFVHSDIKPGNVFVDDADPSDMLVTLLDFGVATAGQALVHDIASREESSRKTFVLQQTGGTIGYAPPFHFSGKATPLSDLYASLVILYELIALDLPWRFAGIAQVPDNILALEAMMMTGPLPIREVRPSVTAADGVVLDAFFKREFQDLHALAETASQALEIEDIEVQRAVVQRLSRLARDYQTRLDELRAEVQAHSEAASASDSKAAREEAQDRNTVPSEYAPRDGRVDALVSGAHERVTVAAAVAPATEVITATRAGSRPSISRRRGSRSGWIVAAVAVPLAAIGAYVYVRSSLANRRVDEVAPVTAPAAITPRPVVPVPEAAQPAHAVARTAVSVDALRNAPVEALPASLSVNGIGRRSARRGARVADTLPPGSQACWCISQFRGARIIARGGTLAREVVLCSATEAGQAGRAEFVGTGSIPASVFGTFPTITCSHGADPLDVSVQRFNTPSGVSTLFRCRGEPVMAAVHDAGVVPGDVAVALAAPQAPELDAGTLLATPPVEPVPATPATDVPIVAPPIPSEPAATVVPQTAPQDVYVPPPPTEPATPVPTPSPSPQTPPPEQSPTAPAPSEPAQPGAQTVPAA